MLRLRHVVAVTVWSFIAGCGTLVDSGVAEVGKEGGKVSSPLGAALIVPEGALDRDVILSIQTAPFLPTGSVIPVEIEPSGTVFMKPATLTFTYPEGIEQPERLKVMTVVNGRWEPLPGHTLDLEARTVSGLVSHLSPYGLVWSSEDCTNGTDDDADGLIDCSDPACTGDNACPSTACVINAQCSNTQYCLNSRCTPTGLCNAHADCAPNYFCQNNQCTKTGSCSSNAQCGAGEVCANGQCAANPGTCSGRITCTETVWDGGSNDPITHCDCTSADGGVFPQPSDGGWSQDAGSWPKYDAGYPHYDGGSTVYDAGSPQHGGGLGNADSGIH